MSEINDSDRIQKILEQYERKRNKEKERYEIIKHTEEFKTKNRQRANNHYQQNKESKKEKYQHDKEFLNAKSQYYYYKKRDNLEKFKTKFPEKVELLKSRNLII